MKKKNIKKPNRKKGMKNNQIDKLIKKIKNKKIVKPLIITILLIIALIFLKPILTIVLVIGIAIILYFNKMIHKAKGKNNKRKILKLIFTIFLSIFCLLLLIGVAFCIYIVLSAPKFDVKKLNYKESTIIYDKDGTEIAKLGAELRENVTYDQLPQVLIDSIIATEDAKFFQHNGFNPSRFLVATLKQLMGRDDAGGASTISMQVIKNSFTSPTSTGIKGIIRKFTDIYLAVFKLEKQFTKEQIFEYYVNNHLLGGNIYGVEEAAQSYFDKDIQDLNLSEASFIAGLFQSPNAYNPYNYPKAAEKRQDTVLYLMRRHKYITKEEGNLAGSVPITSLLSGKEKQIAYQAYVDTVVEEMIIKYKLNPYDIPMIIYSNLDTVRQTDVDNIYNGVTYTWPDDQIQSGAAVVEAATGKILAIGAGRFRTGIRSYNYATMINRQIGSTAKPLFDYGPGIEYENWSTYTQFVDEPYSYSDGTPIKNHDNKYFGNMTLKTALATSRNIPALKAFQSVSNSKILKFVTSLGIQPEVSNGYLHEAHSIGSFNGSNPVAMAGAFAAFNNKGIYNEPYAVSKFIVRNSGEEVKYEQEPVQVMSEATAYIITSVLRYAVQTGEVPGKSRGAQLAGKTGTSNLDQNTIKKYNLPSDTYDLWVVGYDPEVVLSFWLGFDAIKGYVDNSNGWLKRNNIYNSLSYVVFKSNNKSFIKPNSVVEVAIEKGTNPAMLASENTPADLITYELYKKGTEPTEISPVYQPISNPTNLSISYNDDKVKLSWTGVTNNNSTQFGDFGYDLYFNDGIEEKYLGFTVKTSYEYETKEPYGKYIVKSSYKNNKTVQSSGISKTFNAPNNEDLEISLIGNSTIKLNLNEPYIEDGLNILYKKELITKAKTVTTIKFNEETVKDIKTDIAGSYVIEYKVTYKTREKTITRNIIIN